MKAATQVEPPLPVRDPVDKMEQWMRVKGKADTSIERFRDVCEEFRRAIGKKDVYTVDDFERFNEYLVKKEKTKGHVDEPGMKGSYLRLVHYALKRFFKANKWEWYDEDDEELPKLNRPYRPFYLMLEMEKILEATKKGGELRDYIGLRLIDLAMSRRRSWILLKRWDYDPDKGMIKMPSVKGGREVVFELDKETNEAMLRYLATRTDVYPALLPSFRPRNPNGQMRPEYVNRILKKYCGMAGVPCKGLHAFRRGITTYLHNIKRRSETEIWQMGDWKNKDMVGEYVQLGDDWATQGRKESHPLFEGETSRRAPMREGPEETPRERRLRLNRPLAKDLSQSEEDVKAKKYNSARGESK